MLNWIPSLCVDTGIANEKEWGISLLSENVNESGTNEDGSTWYRESGEDLGDNGYRCRWSRMGGQNADGTSEWKETVITFFYIIFGKLLLLLLWKTTAASCLKQNEKGWGISLLFFFSKLQMLLA